MFRDGNGYAEMWWKSVEMKEGVEESRRDKQRYAGDADKASKASAKNARIIFRSWGPGTKFKQTNAMVDSQHQPRFGANKLF